ncbi:MAG: hypothetical protein J0I41_00490 [Filimonas sp.]|nr:hypothetical protein [Filimonas sp.]
MKRIVTKRRQKIIALLLLSLQLIQMVAPSAAWALTSGPSQPEAKGFQQAGVSDMVDLFTGDFKYNIPLLDVDGYPVNINYQAGAGMDEEATWVGLGWNLNVGSINRQLRGLADDAAGESIVTEHYTKPKITVGAKLEGKFEAKGKGAIKGLNGSMSLGIFSDNYTGIGAEVGVNAGLSAGFVNGGDLTATLGLGVTSNTQSGVDMNPSVSLTLREKAASNTTIDPRFSANLGYNTRGGLKSLTLGTSFSVSYADEIGSSSASYDIASSVISYNTPAINPKIQIPYKSTYGSFSISGGLAGGIFFTGVGGNGYKNVREIKQRINSTPAYGFLYADQAKSKKDVVTDFIREKESAIIPDLPNLAMPVHTPDLFSYTNQFGSGQFRLYRSTGAYADNAVEDEAGVATTGGDIGFGLYGHAGITHFDETTINKTAKWTKENNYLPKGDFESISYTNPAKEQVYFKQVGEKNIEDEDLVAALQGDKPVAINIAGRTANSVFSAGTTNYGITTAIAKNRKEYKRTMMQYLTAGEAGRHGLERTLNSYSANTFGSFSVPSCHKPVIANALPRTDASKRSYHLSELTVTDDGGKRMVYGLPVYNVKQDEYSFAVGTQSQWGNYDAASHQVDVPRNGNAIDHYKGIDNYFHKESIPAYASSFLLTSILSPDYVDKTGDGITDDDNGTAIKFDYTKLPYLYKWRTPYSKATLNRGNLADPDDDKASFVYGEKEVWYLNAIETKTKVAYFITEDRNDGLGVQDMWGGIDKSNKLKVLREIRLYSKADMTTPIKVVHFEYGYELCKNVPNFNDDFAGAYPKKGKLTLKKIYFTYGNIDKGKFHPYVFKYANNIDDGANDANEVEKSYASYSADRWGVYKNPSDNLSDAQLRLENDEFPYTLQNKTKADQNVTTWQLNKIELPTGGTIAVTYESDDYAFVQNRRAMDMERIDAFIDGNNNVVNSLKQAKGIRIPVTGYPGNTDATTWFKRNYLNDNNYIYTKTFVNLSNKPDRTAQQNKEYFDFVPCYAKVASVSIQNGFAYVKLENISDHSNPVNPLIMAAWQRMRNDYPRYAYPGYENRVRDNDVGKTLEAAVNALFSAIGNLSELKESFNARAYRKNFASVYDPERSFVRLVKKDGFKLGGGARVKKILISDNWRDMVSPGQPDNTVMTASYGQWYDYTTIYNGQTISSGVASYEPTVGGDENPFRQPIPYVEKIKGAIDNYLNLEEPFGESLFPAPGVGYSKVTVRALAANGEPDALNRTGYTSNEFYTAREFPTFVKATDLKRQERGPQGSYGPFGSDVIHELAISQGYSIELNDMHGKPRATRIYNQSGSEISSVQYYYNSTQDGAGTLKLQNAVDVVTKYGLIKQNKIIGREIELYTDLREQESITQGTAINLGADIFPVAFFIAFLPHWPTKSNDEYKLFRSAVVTKVVQSYGILSKVVKTENGSTATTENLIYDEFTGDPIVTRTNNEFDKPVYTVNMPAYWAYSGMSGAYKSAGNIMLGLSVNNGAIANYASYLDEGDEVVNVNTLDHYWVIKTTTGENDNTPISKRLVDRSGNTIGTTVIPVAKVIRSGYRNMLQASTMSYTLLQHPVINGRLFFSSAYIDYADYKVLAVTAATFNNVWGMPGTCANCPTGYYKSGNTCLPILHENFDQCYSFCAGKARLEYSMNGALIETSTGSQVVRKNSFWGGACFNCDDISRMAGGTSKMSVTSNSSDTPKDTAALVAAKLLSTKNDTIQQNALKTNSVLLKNSGLVSPQMTLDGCTRSDISNPSCNVCGPLVRAGIWLCTGATGNPEAPIKEWIGFDTCINFTQSKKYYFGYAADNRIRIYLDGQLVKSLDQYNTSTFTFWNVSPINVQAGKHHLKVEFYNDDNSAAAAMEIYDNTEAQLLNADNWGTGINKIFSTEGLKGVPVRFSFRTSNGVLRYHYEMANGGIPDICNQNAQISTVVNPYVAGFLGNWQPYETKVFQTLRKDNDVFNSAKRGVNLANSGYLTSVKSYWGTLNNFTAEWQPVVNNPSWVTASTATLIDKYGHPLEQKDALGIYSSATYCFNGELPAAVASNAMNREIFFNGFEDYKLAACLGSNDCQLNALTTGSDLSSYITSAQAHSGNYSIQLNGTPLTLAVYAHNGEHVYPANTLPAVSRYLSTVNGHYEYKLVDGLYPKGFEPKPNKKYLFSAWIKDNSPLSKTINFTVSANGVNVPLTCKAIVEGWKQVEGVIDLSSIQTAPGNISLMLQGSNIYMDDIRIHPNDGHMKSYAYDDKNFRLMAEMDENNFATYYEYDEEGSLTRVKKETPRGIMTIKESRSSYKKQ